MKTKLLIVSLLLGANGAYAKNRILNCEFYNARGETDLTFTALANQNPGTGARIPNFFEDAEVLDSNGAVVTRQKLMAEPLPYRGKGSAAKGGYAWSSIGVNTKTYYDIGLFPEYARYQTGKFAAALDVTTSTFWESNKVVERKSGQCWFTQ